VILHPEARRELGDAARYYERRSTGSGERFMDAVESGFRQIQRSPATWRRIRGNIRRFLVKTFPYGIVYIYRDEEIFVLAIMHVKREPDYWLGRLTSLPRF
jgi:plasmid stabilization system protein ParE